MKMFEAAKEVLMESKVPMHAKDICAEIVRRDLYKFGAKNPASVLAQSLGERSIGNAKGREEIFRRIAPGTYELSSQVVESTSLAE